MKITKKIELGFKIGHRYNINHRKKVIYFSELKSTLNFLINSYNFDALIPRLSC